MPRIVHLLGDEPREPVRQVMDLDPSPAIAWALDPFTPVAEEWLHLVKNPNEEGNTEAQEEGQ